MAKAKLYRFRSVLRRRTNGGREECLVEWEPTFEPARLKDFGVGKYRPLRVSKRVYLVDGVFRSKVHWRPTWEPSRNVGVPSTSGSSELVGSSSKVVDEVRGPDESELGPGWQFRLSSRRNVLYFYCPETGECSFDIPKGTSGRVAFLCFAMQVLLVNAERIKSWDV